jgi:RNA polymerase sigma factor (sigma-70 family)
MVIKSLIKREESKMTVSEEVLTIIEATVEKSMNAVRVNMQPEEGKNYFKETEILLYNYPSLKLKVEQDEKFLYDPDATAEPEQRKSKDIIRFTSGASHGLDIDRYTIGIKSSMMRTRQEVFRISRALNAIEKDRYYKIIEMKYFQEMTMESIAEHYGCEDKTIRRNKNRLVNKLMIMLFGTDALHT